MAKNPFPSFNFYTGDWLSSQARAVMTAEQRGIYIDLLSYSWESDPPCSLPDDEVTLSKLAGMGEAWWLINGPFILQWFTKKKGRLWNQKLMGVFETAKAIRDLKSAGGKLSALKRLKSNRKTLQESLKSLRRVLVDTSFKTAALHQLPTPTPTPTPKEEKKEGDMSPAAHSAEAEVSPVERYTGKDLADWWNEIVAYNGTFARVTLPLSGDRRKKADTRVRELVARDMDPVDYYQGVLNKLRGTAFCRGENDRGWRADFDWLIKNESSAQRILEGKYANQKAGSNGSGRQGNLSGHQNSLRA